MGFFGQKSAVCREKKRCTCVLLPWQQYLDKGRCMTDIAPSFLLSVFCLKSFFTESEHQTRILFLIPCINELNNEMDPLSWLQRTDTDHGGCGCMTWTNTNRISSLRWDSFVRHIAQLWEETANMEMANTSVFYIFEFWLIYYSLKQWNNTTIYCSSERAPAMSPALFWKVKNFIRWSPRNAQSGCTKTAEHSKKDAGRCTFALCGRLLLQTLSAH